MVFVICICCVYCCCLCCVDWLACCVLGLGLTVCCLLVGLFGGFDCAFGTCLVAEFRVWFVCWLFYVLLLVGCG